MLRGKQHPWNLSYRPRDAASRRRQVLSIPGRRLSLVYIALGDAGRAVIKLSKPRLCDKVPVGSRPIPLLLEIL